MKEEILNYLRYDRSYESGIPLYMKYGNRASFKKQLNLQAKSPAIHQTMLEEFRRLLGMDLAALNRIIAAPVSKKPVAKEEPKDPFQDPPPVIPPEPVSEEQETKEQKPVDPDQSEPATEEPQVQNLEPKDPDQTEAVQDPKTEQEQEEPQP